MRRLSWQYWFRYRRFRSVLFILGLICAAAANAAGANMRDADLVVYGATAAGVFAAYSAAHEGLSVILLEPRAHVGGMVTGGLSATDLGKFQVIGGYARDFYLRAAAHYGIHDLNKPENWRSEPHVDEEIFREMLAEAGVKVYFHEKLREHRGVHIAAGKIESITTMDGKRWAAKIFADCSYEGDLMASAGVKYVYGRESMSAYGESLAGVRAKSPTHQFTFPLSAYDKDHKLYPEVDRGPLAPAGSEDKLVQAYNFRLILTRDPANRIPFPRPKHYDPARFALLARYLQEFEKNMGRPPVLHDVAAPVPIPGNKADFNNRGPFSTDYIGHSWSYPDASYKEKDRIWKDHLEYTQQLMYFLSHDKCVPSTVQRELNEWGLPRDEFLDTGHWPNQLYIREARRMVGAYVMRQSDLQTERTKPDSIGMGSYNSDSHHVQRVAQADGSVTNEGCVEVPVEPYEIPYRVMVPQRSEMQNLLVPVSVSATHTAYSSIRMEPQYMILGQAAGVAASLAAKNNTAVQDISIEAMQENLHRHKAVLHLSDASVNLPLIDQGAK